jgi:hypothetical protein
MYAVAGACLLTPAGAETYYQHPGDPSGGPAGYGYSSIRESDRWYTQPNGGGDKATVAPTTPTGAGNHYITGTTLRTPLNGTAYTFYADSLTVNTIDGNIMFKATASTTLTFTGSLILNDGAALNQNTATSGNPGGFSTIQTLSAPIGIYLNDNVTFKQTQGLNGTGDQLIAKMVIDAPLIGGGALLISNMGGNANTGWQLTLNGDNSAYTGDITLINGSTNLSAATSTSLIIAEGSNLGTGSLALGIYSILTLKDADALALNSGLVIDHATTQINLDDDIIYNLQSFTYSGTTYTDAGYTIGGMDSSADLKINQIIGNGWFEIIAIPEPTTWLLLSVGAGLLIFLRPRK